MKFHATISKLVEYPSAIVCGGSPHKIPLFMLTTRKSSVVPVTFIYWDQGYKAMYISWWILFAGCNSERHPGNNQPRHPIPLLVTWARPLRLCESRLRGVLFPWITPDAGANGTEVKNIWCLGWISENLFKVGDVLYGIPTSYLSHRGIVHAKVSDCRASTSILESGETLPEIEKITI